ncbi:MAG: hypothetical protein PHQ75_09305, partial [Thermoguttaceae bacterium]|nr:hypothetical protein [Thermoguttaceae bacterium]
MMGKKAEIPSTDKNISATLARQWRLIKMLVDCPQGRTLNELATACDMSRFTIYRDILALQVVLGPFQTR